MNNYKLGSLFDGSGGFPLAGALCGIEPMWAAEVEPYPIAVTRSRFPNMKHLGDISKVNGAEIEPVDIITFGSPCQDLSVAGKRAGLKHTDNGDEETTRSGLFMEAVRIIKEMRTATNGKYPRFAIWENVPGAFSSNNGEDFRIVCEELIKVVEPSAVMPEVPQKGWNYADSYIGDGWSLAYRVFDAQYWGVPQRRRRIYLVADFGGECAREVLFEREGLRGYFAKGRTPWQAAPADAQGSPGADDREGKGFDGYNGDITGDKSATLGVNCGQSSGRNGVIERGRQLDAVVVTNAIGGNAENSQETQIHPTLTNGSAPGFQNAVAYTLKIRSGCEGGGKGALIQEDKSATLATNNDQYLFQPMAIENHPADSRVNIDDSGKVQTLTSRMGTGGGNVPMVMEPFVKSGRARSADDATTWKEGKVANTLNTFDTGETRANELVVQAPVICLQGNGIDRADTAGCNGKGWKEDTCYTLNTIDRPAVAYGLDRASFNQGQNAKFDFTVSEERQPTLTARGPGAVCTIGLNGAQVSPTLISRMSSAVGTTQDNLIVTEKHEREGHPALCCTTGGFTQATEEVSPTLMARDWKDPTCVLSNYIVRRLTPTECARLQGFADWWGWIEEKKALTEEEYKFWMEVRNTHARINGKKEQDYTEKQMLTWYNKLWTDSAEYKMWDNGIALPTALYCIQGMAEALARAIDTTEDDDDDWML